MQMAICNDTMGGGAISNSWKACPRPSPARVDLAFLLLRIKQGKEAVQDCYIAATG